MNIQTSINPSFIDDTRDAPSAPTIPNVACATSICRVHQAQSVTLQRNAAQLQVQWQRCLSYGHWQTIKTMIVDGSAAQVVNTGDTQGRTALMQAVCARRLDIVLALSAVKQLRINATDHDGNTALLLAAYLGDERLIAALAGADPNVVDHEGNTALIVAVNQQHMRTVLRLQRMPRTEINIANSVGLTALHCGALADHSGIVDALLNDERINVNAVDENGHSALMLAAANGHLACAELLRNDPRCKVNLRDGENQTAAMLEQQYEMRQAGLRPSPSTGCYGRLWPEENTGAVSRWLRLRCCSNQHVSSDAIPLVSLTRRRRDTANRP